jgi:hypothetical protein
MFIETEVSQFAMHVCAPAKYIKTEGREFGFTFLPRAPRYALLERRYLSKRAPFNLFRARHRWHRS